MNKAWKMVLALTAMLAAGCTEGTVAPPSQASDMSIAGGGSNASLSSYDTVRFNFYIDPARPITYSLGQGNTVSFPAHSLCDVNSSYGPSEWDKPCAPSTRAVLISAKAWLDKTGHPRIDFNPSVRFVPSGNPANWVILTFADQVASQDPFFNILYCASATDKKCIDESKKDPSLATMRDPITGRVYRRVKHFSGYISTSGDGCDPSSDPNCPSGDGGGFDRVGLKGSGPGY